MEIANGPKFRPLLETNFQQVGTQSFLMIDTYDAIHELAAGTIWSWRVQFACGVTSGPDALRAVLAPRKNGACDHSVTKFRKLCSNTQRQGFDCFDRIVYLCFVHLNSSLLNPNSLPFRWLR